MSEVIASVRARCEDRAEIPADEPLFLLSAGWRSGSTLVQRLVNSGTACFLWGEPYSRADLVPRLADSLRPITDDWPRDADLLHENDGSVADRWTANLHPGAETLLDGHRALLRTLFAPPAGAPAGSGWGFKEVRLSAEHALYLHLLLRRAKPRSPPSAGSSSATRTWSRAERRSPPSRICSGRVSTKRSWRIGSAATMVVRIGCPGWSGG
jgi:hypothetical protein